MFKRIMQFFSGQKEQPVKKEEAPLNPIEALLSQLSESEEESLDYIQSEIKKARLLAVTNPEDAETIFRTNMLILQGLLVTKMNSHRADKLELITENLRRYVEMLVSDQIKQYGKALELIQAQDIFLSDARLYGSNNTNVLAALCDLYFYQIAAAINLEKDFESLLQNELEMIALLHATVNSEEDILLASLMYGQLADLFMTSGYHSKATEFYQKIFEFIHIETIVDLTMKREAATYLGHYVANVLHDESFPLEKKEELCKKELDLYSELDAEIEDARSKLDLGIAYSHWADFNFNLKKYRECSQAHFLKLGLLLDALKMNSENEDEDANNERISTSIVHSMQPIINCALMSEMENQVEIFEECLKSLGRILNIYEENIQLFQYANGMAMWLFNFYCTHDTVKADSYIYIKFKNLDYLISIYGKEDGIMADLLETYRTCEPFFTKNEKTISSQTKELWDKLAALL